MPRLELPNAADIVDDWQSGSSAAASDFVNAARGAADTWLQRASSDAAQQNYETQMQDPNVLARRQQNINDTARQNYDRSLESFGQQRYQSGVQAGGEEFQQSMQTVFSAVEGINIPDRGTPMSSANMDRFRQTAEAFHEAGQQT